MVLTQKTTFQTTGYPGNDLKQLKEDAGNSKTMLNIQSFVSTSGADGLNIQSQYSHVQNSHYSKSTVLILPTQPKAISF